mmetsp:Transcript_24692/g.53186  ORF Transcript_24692/g.53186 Transcript_24692/m.53186 type:complete len:202 (-) Transcript_24692:453-1058(-)
MRFFLCPSTSPPPSPSCSAAAAASDAFLLCHPTLLRADSTWNLTSLTVPWWMFTRSTPSSGWAPLPLAPVSWLPSPSPPPPRGSSSSEDSKMACARSRSCGHSDSPPVILSSTKASSSCVMSSPLGACPRLFICFTTENARENSFPSTAAASTRLKSLASPRSRHWYQLRTYIFHTTASRPWYRWNAISSRERSSFTTWCP